MSELLASEQCQACRPDSPTVTGEDAAALLAELPGWQIVVQDGMEQLSGDFEFANFADALAFTNRVGALAEEADHHPAITTEWGRVNVRWWTHSIGGLHRNDFIMAARASGAAGARDGGMITESVGDSLADREGGAGAVARRAGAEGMRRPGIRCRS